MTDLKVDMRKLADQLAQLRRNRHPMTDFLITAYSKRLRYMHLALAYLKGTPYSVVERDPHYDGRGPDVHVLLNTIREYNGGEPRRALPVWEWAEPVRLKAHRYNKMLIKQLVDRGMTAENYYRSDILFNTSELYVTKSDSQSALLIVTKFSAHKPVKRSIYVQAKSGTIRNRVIINGHTMDGEELLTDTEIACIETYMKVSKKQTVVDKLINFLFR